MAGRRLTFSTPGPETPQLGRVLSDRNTSSSPATDNKVLLSAISGLSRQLGEFATNITRQLGEFTTDVSRDFRVINDRLQSLEERLGNVTSDCNGCSIEESKKKRRLHNPKIAEAVRRLHNSDANCRRYDPEQSLNSPYNEAVTTCLVGALAASPELRDEGLDKHTFVETL